MLGGLPEGCSSGTCKLELLSGILTIERDVPSGGMELGTGGEEGAGTSSGAGERCSSSNEVVASRGCVIDLNNVIIVHNLPSCACGSGTALLIVPRRRRLRADPGTRDQEIKYVHRHR